MVFVVDFAHAWNLSLGLQVKSIIPNQLQTYSNKKKKNIYVTLVYTSCITSDSFAIYRDAKWLSLGWIRGVPCPVFVG